MSESKRQKYIQALEVFRTDSMYPPEEMCVAIIYTKLGEYFNALKSYRSALKGFLEIRRSWMGQINWVIDCFILAHQPSLYVHVSNVIEDYAAERRRALMGYYSSAVIRLVGGEDKNAMYYVSELLKRSKIKDTCALGRTIESIIKMDQPYFNEALKDLLQIHNGRAKFGSLRESPEGFMSLSAMSLSKIALERGLTINIENEYLSKGYLEFLMHQE
jgi:hypothetical protein